MEKLKVIKRIRNYEFNLGNVTVDIIKAGNNGRYHRIILKLDAIITDDNLIARLVDDISNMLSYYDVNIATNISKNSLIVEYFYSDDAQFASLDARVTYNEEGTKVYFENVVNVIVRDITDEKK